jgi:hypothetical protein
MRFVFGRRRPPICGIYDHGMQQYRNCSVFWLAEMGYQDALGHIPITGLGDEGYAATSGAFQLGKERAVGTAKPR